MGITGFGAAHKELFAAERAISDMRTARKFADFEESWRRFLNATEKCWTKIENAGKSIASDFQPWLGQYTTRSEEHTSELQSQSNLVCRILHVNTRIPAVTNS